MTKLEELREYLNQKIGDRVRVIYDRAIGPYNNRDRIRIKRDDFVVCSIYDTKSPIFNVIFYDPFICRSAGFSAIVNLTLDEVPKAIKNRINIYESTAINDGDNKEKEVKNMANRRFIVEKMEVEQRYCEPDVINMTVRKEPDGIPFQTGRDLRTLIESVDPDKISNDAIEKSIYMMTARGSGKTRWVSELLKNKTVVYNGNIHTNIENVIFNDPATIVFWTDGSKTVVKCQKGETFDPEKGLAMAISKKVLGNDYGYYETFAKYVGRYNKKRFNKALEEAKKIPPDEITYNGETYVLKNKEE